ncbi:MAG: ABC transporter permease [Bacteroidia bacterium]|nr:ABC transporter permease [Bacteroidia bacterium]
MFDLDQWQEIFSTLAKNPLRTFLTAFGVGWGMFMLIVMMGAGNGLENGVSREFTNVATNSFFLWGQSTSKPYNGFGPGRRMQMNENDYLAIKEQVPNAATVAPRNQLNGFQGGNNVIRGAKSGDFEVMGDFPQIKEVEGIDILEGRFLNQNDMDQRRKIAVIGTRVQDLLFEPDEDPIGENIRINGVYFTIVGVFGTRTNGDRGERDESKIYIPFSTFQRAFNNGNRVGWFAIRSSDGVPASEVLEDVIDILKRRHSVAPDDNRAFGNFNLEKQYNQIKGLFGGIRLLVWIVGVGTLIAGVIGVSNIMLVIVKERTKEIGIRRAIGARPRHIISQILFESITLTSLAGYVGLMAGMLSLDAVSALVGENAEMFLNPRVEMSMVYQALAVLVVAGAIAGLIPARKALAVHPVEALRAD